MPSKATLESEIQVTTAERKALAEAGGAEKAW